MACEPRPTLDGQPHADPGEDGQRVRDRSGVSAAITGHRRKWLTKIHMLAAATSGDGRMAARGSGTRRAHTSSTMPDGDEPLALGPAEEAGDA